MYDLLIENCRIIDGTGEPSFKGYVAIKDGKISKIGKDYSEKEVDTVRKATKEVIDGNNLYLAPGFIDIHSHSDTSLAENPLGESRILQGVTTEIGGNCGISAAPVSRDSEKRRHQCEYIEKDSVNWNTVSEYLDYMEETPVSVNFGTAVGHGSIRIAAMGFDNRKQTEDEMNEMKRLLRESMEGGAFSMSTGLIYPPGCFADTEELTELAKELKKYNSFYMTHMREEGRYVVDSVKEAIEISEKAGIPLQISHHKVTYKEGWNKLCLETTRLIEEARERGVDVMADQYPYRASATSLDSNIPEWAFEGGIDALFERLRNPEVREVLKKESNDSHKGRWCDIYVSFVESEKNQWTIGKSIEEIAKIRGVDPADACFDLVLEENDHVNEINFGMCENDIEYIMKKPYVCIGSDGKAIGLDYPGRPHPRYFGTFPRVISHYARERKLFALECAINKMTGLPAKRLGLTDRGCIAEGMWADLVLFDFDTIKDTPTFENPTVPCEGIEKVFVNGILTCENGKHTGAKAGMVLRKRV